jgi:hypothetical protein
MIEDACFNHDNTIVNLCEKICEGSECCFEGSGDVVSCNGIQCSTYQACAGLHVDEDSINDLTEKCNSDDRSDCVAACGIAACCYTQNINKICDVTHPGLVCENYKPCEILYGV